MARSEESLVSITEEAANVCASAIGGALFGMTAPYRVGEFVTQGRVPLYLNSGSLRKFWNNTGREAFYDAVYLSSGALSAISQVALWAYAANEVGVKTLLVPSLINIATACIGSENSRRHVQA